MKAIFLNFFLGFRNRGVIFYGILSALTQISEGVVSDFLDFFFTPANLV